MIYWHQRYVIVSTVTLAYYLPVYFFYELKWTQENMTNSSVCGFANGNAVLLISYMDLGIRVVMPFIFMVLFSILLSLSLIKSRKRLVENFLAEENSTYYKEIRLTASSICLNLIYVFTQLPFSITIFYSDYFSNILYVFTYYLFYLSYAINFYIILPSNSLFREGFFNIFKK